MYSSRVMAVSALRFGLTTRVERREMDVYELEVDEGGIRMTEAQPLDQRTNELLSGDGHTPEVFHLGNR